jgi:hypothetical protein
MGIRRSCLQDAYFKGQVSVLELSDGTKSPHAVDSLRYGLTRRVRRFVRVRVKGF